VSAAEGPEQGREPVHNTNNGVIEEDPGFDMELAVRPPQRIAAGVTLETPLVITFKTPSVEQRSTPDPQDLSGKWANLSLVSDRKQKVAPPQGDLLLGRLSDSIHPLDTADDRQPFAYAAFSGVSITRPGRYCFQVNIIDMTR
jgi:hypothetical protein